MHARRRRYIRGLSRSFEKQAKPAEEADADPEGREQPEAEA